MTWHWEQATIRYVFTRFWAIMKYEDMKHKSEACLQYDKITVRGWDAPFMKIAFQTKGSIWRKRHWDIMDLTCFSKGFHSNTFRFRHTRTAEYKCKHLMPRQNARSFIADDYISHIRIKFPKLFTTCMGCKHYVEDFNQG